MDTTRRPEPMIGREVIERLGDNTVMKAVADTAPVGIAVADPTGKVVFANATANSILGNDAMARSLASSAWHVASGPDAVMTLPFFRALEGERVTGEQVSLVGEDGQSHAFEINAAPLLDAENRVEGVIESLQDITQRESVRAQQRRDDQQLLPIANRDVIGLAFLDRSGEIRDVNHRFAEILGFAREQLITKTLSDIVTARQKQSVAARIQNCFNGAPPNLFPMRVLRQNRAHGELLAHLTLGEHAGETVVIAFVIDLDDRSDLRDRLTASEEQYRLLVETAPDAILIYDVDRKRFIDANTRAEDLLRLRVSDLVQRDLISLYGHGADLDDVIKADKILFDRALAGERVETERQFRRGSGHLALCEMRLSAFPSCDGRRVRISLLDITEATGAKHAADRATRALMTLSSGNELLSRATDENDLRQAMCELIVRHGGYAMACIGFAENDANKSVKVVAQAGDCQRYSAEADISWADDDRGRGPTGTAIRSGQPQVNQDFATNPAVERWRMLALGCGFRSSAAFPLTTPQGTIGALTLYARERDAFDRQELTFLMDLSKNIAFGLETLRTRQAKAQIERRIEWLAYHDEETKQLNKAGFLRQVSDLIARCSTSALPLTVIALSMQHKDTATRALIHENLAAVMWEVMRRAGIVLRKQDIVARTTDESYAVALSGLTSESAGQIVESLRSQLAGPIELPECEARVFVGVTAGISSFPEHADTPEVLLQRAEIALHAAVRSGRPYLTFAEPLNLELRRRVAVASDLHDALQQEQIEVYYQPKIRLTDQRLIGAEALVRWRHPTEGMIPPSEFIPLAEENGLIGDLTNVVLKNVLRQFYGWSHAGFSPKVSINLSARGGLDVDFPRRLRDALASWDVRPPQIMLELTETTLMENLDIGVQVLENLKQLGFEVSLDDFDTGYSSLLYLQRFPVDEIKLDRTFVRSAMQDRASRQIARGIVSLGHDLGRRIVAEGIEDEATVRMVTELGCDIAQGYHFAKPMAAKDFADWVERWEKAPTVLSVAS